VKRSAHLFAAALLIAFALPANAVVERYKDEALYLARLAELGYDSLQEDFEGSDWDSVRSNYPALNYAASITSKSIEWESAGKDLTTWPGTTALISTNQNWARGAGWGIFDNYLASTLRITTPAPIYGIGFWVKTNPGGQDVGIFFEDRFTVNEPGYLMSWWANSAQKSGAMYPGDIHPFGHGFVGFIDPDGFTEVIVTGTLEVNEEGQLEGGTVHGADDFTFAVPPGFILSPLESWRASHFTAADLADPTKEATVWGNTANPDHSSRNNWEENVFGGDPLDATDEGFNVQLALTPTAGAPLFGFTYPRRTNDPSLLYTPTQSDDLQIWHSGPGLPRRDRHGPSCPGLRTRHRRGCR
jgi:hypothetical protein